MNIKNSLFSIDTYSLYLVLCNYCHFSNTRKDLIRNLLFYDAICIIKDIRNQNTLIIISQERFNLNRSLSDNTTNNMNNNLG